MNTYVGYNKVVSPVSTVVSHGYAAAPAYAGLLPLITFKRNFFFVYKLSVTLGYGVSKVVSPYGLAHAAPATTVYGGYGGYAGLGKFTFILLVHLIPNVWGGIIVLIFNNFFLVAGYTSKVVAPVAPVSTVVSHGIAAAPAYGNTYTFIMSINKPNLLISPN